MTPSNDTPAQLSIWYFVGALFIFIAPVVFFPGSDLWVTILCLVLGFVAIVLGGIQFGREVQARRRSADGD